MVLICTYYIAFIPAHKMMSFCILCLQREKAENEQTIAHYKQLKSLDVDLTQYIVNEAVIPRKVTRVVTEGSNKPTVHLHLKDNGSTMVE